MKQITRLLLTCTAIMGLTLAGCSNNKSDNESIDRNENRTPTKEDVTVTNPEEDTTIEEIDGLKNPIDEATNALVESEIPMRDFFLPNNSKAHYKGEGNEFAELDIEVVQPYDNYIIVYENNGGAYMQNIYKIGMNKIELLAEDVIEFDPLVPTLEQLEKMKPIDIYLQQPFDEGTKFEEWTIVEIGATVKTPYKTFDKAIVIESQEDNFVNRKYFVQGFGEVKREAIMSTEGEEDFIVTSTLESVE